MNNAKTRTQKYAFIRTYAREPLLAKAHEHVEAEVAIRRFAEVFEPPHMVPVFFHVLALRENGFN